MKGSGGRALFSLLVLLCTATVAAQQTEGASMAAGEEIRVLNERIGKRPIDVKQGGQFIEPLCNLIPSMLAQQVANDSFEEEPPYKVAYKPEIDKPYRPWCADGSVHAAQISYETENAFNGKRALKIAIAKARCRAGISQDGFCLKEGVAYRLRLHMRGEGNAPAWASLHGDGGMAAGPEPLGRTSETWTPVDVKLRAAKSIENATLTIECEGPGAVWLDRVYLIGEDAVLGLWRPDVVDALKAMNPGVVRWGGSTMEGYEWTDCIGPWDKRAPFTTCWGGLEPNFVGMEEFVQLCRHVGAEPLLCIRWTGKRPEDAAAQVEYFNGGTETKFGRARADNGHPEPYRVKYWQIGNEVGGEGYDASVRAFATAMKAVDPGIKILSSFLTDQTLAKGGEYLDYLCPHHYGCADLVGKDAEFRKLQEQIARDAAGRDVRVAVTEWNTTAGDWGLGRGTLQTLSNALSCARYHNLMHRHADLVEIAIRSNLVDSFGSGVIQTGPGWMYLAPTYYAQQLYQRAARTFPVRIERGSQAPWNELQPDLSATVSEDGKTLRIYAVNATPDPLEARFQLVGFAGKPAKATAHVLKDRAESLCPEVMNSRDDPNRITTEQRPLETPADTMQATLQPLSLTLLEISLGAP